MCLAFFHGEQIVFGILLISAVFWLTALVLFVWKWRYFTQYRLYVSIGYLLFVAAVCLLMLSDNDFFGSIIGTAVTLPWSMFVPEMLGAHENPSLAGSTFLCGVINAALFYVGADYLARSLKRTPPI